MAIIRWNPWNISSIFDDDWDLPTIPRINQGLNIYETDNEVVAEVSVPGIPEEKIDVSTDKGVVRISAANEENTEEKTKRKYFASSMATSFNYSFRLPEGIVNEDKVDATLSNGVLKLVFAKKEDMSPKKIKINKK